MSASSSFQKEEKKEEEETIANNSGETHDTIDTIHNTCHSSSPKSSPPPKSKLSRSMQMMIKTISKDTPSPLSGYIGSTLQCCACKHVRSTKETPFLEIPIVPTSISNAYSSVTPMNRSSSLSPCTLYQCLADFTSIERVHEVDCRACSMKEEIHKLDKEACTLRNAIESLLKKKKRNNNRNNARSDQDQEALVLLQRDLGLIEERIRFLICTDPDVEDEDGECDASLDDIDENIFRDFGNDENVLDDVDLDMMTTNASHGRQKLPKAHRVDANKRLLLTRLPPVLCLHVKRLYFDPVTNQNTKSPQHIDFPEYLDVTSLCAQNVLVSGSGQKDNAPMKSGSSSCSISNDNELQKSFNMNGAISREMDSMNGEDQNHIPYYRLMSVIEHRGNAFSGHYLTYRRVTDKCYANDDNRFPNNIRRNENWVVVSDDKVAYIEWSVVKNCQAYMLMYEAV